MIIYKNTTLWNLVYIIIKKVFELYSYIPFFVKNIDNNYIIFIIINLAII